MPVTLGELLREGRLKQRFSLMECSKRTHVALKYLEAMEADDWMALPSESHRQGFLGLYTRFLGIHPETWKPLYTAKPTQYPVNAVPTQAPVAPPSASSSEVPQAPKRHEAPQTTAQDSQLAVSWHHAVGGVLVFLSFIWGGYHLIWNREVSEKAMAPITRERIEVTRLPTTHTPVAGVQRLRIRANEKVWIQLSSAGRLMFEGYLPAGNVQEWSREGTLTFLVEHPEKMELYWNDQHFPLSADQNHPITSITLPADLVRLSTSSSTVTASVSSTL